MAKKTKKKVKVKAVDRDQEIKDLLNKALILANKDLPSDFMNEVSSAIEELLGPDEEQDDYLDSDDYYDSSC